MQSAGRRVRCGAALLLACLVVHVSEIDAAAEPTTRWYVATVNDQTCAALCAAAAPAATPPLACAVTRQALVRSADTFKVVYTAIDKSSQTAIPCSTITGTGNTVAAPFITVASDGLTATCTFKPASVAVNGDAACGVHPSGSTGRRICCCLAAGESGTTMCPLSAADCGVGTFWDENTAHCVVNCPTGYVPHSGTPRICARCPRLWGGVTPWGSTSCVGTARTGWLLPQLEEMSCSEACSAEATMRNLSMMNCSTPRQALSMSDMSLGGLDMRGTVMMNDRGHTYACESKSWGGGSPQDPSVTGATVTKKWLEKNPTPFGHDFSYTTTKVSGTCNAASASTTCEAAGGANTARICCCTAPGESAKAMCATQASDCDESSGSPTMWYSDLQLCRPTPEGCAAGYYKDVSVPQCAPCPIGKYNAHSGQTECSAMCPTGTYGASLIVTGMTACFDCPAWGNSTPAGSLHCIGPQRTGWGRSRSQESCNEFCARDVRADASCQASRMRMVRSTADFHSANDAIVADRGAAAAFQCGGVNAPNPCTGKTCPGFLGQYDSGSKACSTGLQYSNTNPCTDKGHSWLLCCCSSPTENNKTMCPLSAADCPLGMEYEVETNRCHECSAGRWRGSSHGSGGACAACTTGRWSNLTRRGVDCEMCNVGSYANESGSTACYFCSKGHFTSGTSSSVCEECSAGRITAKGRAACTRAPCPDIRAKLQSQGVSIDQSSMGGSLSVFDLNTPIDANPMFGDVFQLKCNDGSKPLGPTTIVCGANGQWIPNPLEEKKLLFGGTYTACGFVACPPLQLLAALARFLRYEDKGAAQVGNKTTLSVAVCPEEEECAKQIVGAYAPSVFQLVCPADAVLLLTNGSRISPALIAPEVSCLTTGSWFTSVGIETIRCQCAKGWHSQGTRCLPCPDDTFAPLNLQSERAECRTCPRDGASCSDGVLKILPDWWYDTRKYNGEYNHETKSFATAYDSNEKTGLRASTGMYRCTMRDACLVNKTAVPQTMYCDENHTGVLCTRCYNRRVDCGRIEGPEQVLSCPSPSYFARGKEDMYFAPIARHCIRCPAGVDAYWNYAITLVVAVGILFATALLIVLHLRDVESSVIESARSGGDDEEPHRANATGAIARLLLNWMQATALLSTIKFTPPEAVKDASVAAEYAQGFSVTWFPVRCTLRWGYYATFAWELLYPMIACLLPALFVISFGALRRLVSRTCTQIGERVKMTPDEFAKHIAKKEAASAEQEATRRRELIKRAIACGFEPPIFEEDDAEGAETPSSLVEDGGNERSESSEAQSQFVTRIALALSTPSATTPTNESEITSVTLSINPDDAVFASTRMATETQEGDLGELGPAAQARLDSRTLREKALLHANPNDTAIHAARRFDARCGFYRNVCGKKIRARVAPSMDAATFADRLVPVNAIVRAEELALDFIRISGVWGTAWLPRRDERGNQALRPVAAGQVIITQSYSAQSSTPLDRDEWLAFEDFERKDEVLHRFHALHATCPEGGITWDVVQLAMPTKMSEFEIDVFMRKYDADKDGQLDLEEYRAADAELVSKWRYASTWSLFSLADDDRDGVVGYSELLPVLPVSVGKDDVHKWMARYDKSGMHGVITIADFAALMHAVRRDDRITVIGAAVTMGVFLSYIKTSKGIMAMFSTESIEGKAYLKQEVGTPAYTDQHRLAIAFAIFYGGVFVIGTPVAALYTLYLNRDRLNHRRIRSSFGFLFEGYRKRMFFWEFVVLLRKVLILAVALFWEDAFLQSIAGLFVLSISIIVHMACWPYEETFLNIAELASLFSLFTLVVLSILLWYARQRSSSFELYELAVTLILFVLFAGLGAVLIGRVIYLELRERSLVIARKLKFTQPLFQQVRTFEEFVRWNASGGTLETSAEASPADPWTFARPVVMDGDEENAETKVELMRRLWQRQHATGGRADQGGSSAADVDAVARRSSTRVETCNPAMSALSERGETDGGGGEEEGNARLAVGGDGPVGESEPSDESEHDAMQIQENGLRSSGSWL